MGRKFIRRLCSTLIVANLVFLFIPRFTTYASNNWAFPLDNYYVSGYDFPGPVNYSDGKCWHLGEDAHAPAGTPVKAACGGKIMFSNYAGSFGYVVIIDHLNGYCTIYGHLGKDGLLAAGTPVLIGAVIGKTGVYSENGGWSEHLHFGIYSGGFGTAQGNWPSWAKGRESASLPMPTGWVDPSNTINSQPTQSSAPQLSSPSDNVTIQSGTTTTFSWSNTGASRYKIRFINSSGAGSIDINVNGTSYSFTPNNSGNWTWKVCAFPDSGVEGTYSAERHFTVPPSSSSSPGSVHVDYYNNIQLSGGVVWSENIGSISKNWGTSSPGGGVLNDNFSARFTQQAYFSGGWYKFHYEVDDAIKIWIDGDCKVDKWGSHVLNEDSQAVNISAGTHEIRVDYADYGGEAKIAVSWYSTAAPASGQSDLQPTAIIQSGEPVVGKQITLDSGVSNFGNADSGVFNISWYINGSRVGSGSHEAVPAGITLTNGNSACLWTPSQAGTYFIQFVVDTDNFVSESNESNNEASITVTIQDTAAEPDLVPMAITYSGSDLVVGKTIAFHSGVANTGNKSVGAFYCAWNVFGSSSESVFAQHAGIPAISSSVDESDTYYLTPSKPGTYEITFTVDAYDYVMEKDESNNAVTITITIQDNEKLPDLVPYDITYGSGSPVVGEQIRFHSGAGNLGEKSSGIFNAAWTITGTYSESVSAWHDSIPEASGYSDESYSYYWTPSKAGVYTIKFAVDPNNDIKEKNEDNNEYSIVITVRSKENTNTAAFADISDKAWYYGYVSLAVDNGIMVGTSKTTFNPEGSLTVAEAVTLAARVHNMLHHGNSYTFDQTSGYAWYSTYIDYAVAHGIINSNDFWDYSLYATRAQMAYIFAHSVDESGLAAINTVHALPDVSGGDLYGREIFLLYRAGVLTGNDIYGTFDPYSSITRASVAAIITRVTFESERKHFSLLP